MEPGKVIEFIEERSFLTAVITRIKGGKLQVISESDREMSISSGRIVHQSPNLNLSRPRQELVKALQDISRKRSSLADTVNLIEVWELLEGEGEDFTFDFLAELAWPAPVDGDHVAAVMRRIFSDGVYFKMKGQTAARHSTEKVQQIVEIRSREEQRERELAEGGSWLGRVWSGDLSDEPECRDRIVKVLRELALYGAEAQDYRWGQKLLAAAGLGADPIKPFYLLVKLGEMFLHENLDLVRQGTPTVFPAEQAKEAERLARKMTWREEDRRDLTSRMVITADSGGAKDFDDAVSLEELDDRLLLGVHIADVSSVVLPDTPLDLEARRRATSIYMPDQRIPMLPEILSEELLSLQEGEIRPAFSLEAELTPEGEVLKYEFFPSLVRVKRRLSYQDVDAAVDHDQVLARMYALSQALKKRRIDQGALLLPLPKLNVFLTPEGEIGVNMTLWENPGRSMISEFMILANHLAARFLRDQQASCAYRSQAEPSERLVSGDTDCADLFLCLSQRRFINRVTWEMDPLPHSGMGLEVYTNLTSPLRRYLDLVIQRQVRSVVAGKPPAYSQEEMDAVLSEVDIVRRRALKLQNKRRRYWLLRYLEGQGAREYDALVLEKFPHRYRIFLIDLMTDADLPIQAAKKLEPGETIRIRVKRVDAREDSLKFALV